MLKKIAFIPAFLFLFSVQIISQEAVNFVNYGPTALIEEGDDDFLQVFIVAIDSSVKKELDLILFDVDCGGENDLSFGEFNSEFSFSFYGGTDIYANPAIRQPYPDRSLINKGKLLWRKILAVDEIYNDKWVSVLKFLPNEGEYLDGKFYFKFVAEGLQGNDANVYNIKIRDDDNSSEGIKILNYCPTIRLAEKSQPIQIKFNMPESDRITVFNFDADGTALKIVTPFRSDLNLTSSLQGTWVSNTIKIMDLEKLNTCAIEFGPGGNAVNEATFYIKTENEYLPAVLPITAKLFNNKPELSYTVKYSDNCKELVLDASTSSDKDNNKIKFKWVIDQTNILEGPEVSYTFPMAGTYKVILAGIDNSGVVENGSYKTIDVIVNEAPSAIAGKDLITLPGKLNYFDASHSFDDDGSISKYLWDFGDGSRAEGKIVSHAFEKPGRYKVVLKCTDNSNSPCDFDFDSLEVRVNASPVAKAGSDIAASVNEILQFNGADSYDDDGNIKIYKWDFGDGNTSTEINPSYKYNRPGKYTVTLSVMDNSYVENNINEDQLIVTINNPPTAKAGKNLVAAFEEVITFDASGSTDSDGEIIEYLWNFGDGNSSTEKIAQHSYKKAGIYEVQLKIKDNSGTSTSLAEDKIFITVNSAPIAKAGDDIYQTNSKVNFDASSSYDSDGSIVFYEWDFGDGTNNNEIKTTHVYVKPGLYEVKLRVKDNTSVSNNTSTDRKSVKINARPIADAGPDVITSPGESITLIGNNSLDPDGQITAYEWTIGDSVLSTESQFVYTTDSPGIYSINLKVTDNFENEKAVDYDNLVIIVNAAPVANAGVNRFTAPGETVTFSALNSFDPDGILKSYLWEVNNNKISDKPEFQHLFTEPGIYDVILTVTDNLDVPNSTAKTKIKVFVNSAPAPKTHAEIYTCSTIVNLDASESADSDGDKLTYNWLIDNNTILIGKTIDYDFKKAGSYPVLLTVDDGKGLKNSKVSASVKVKINSAPVANAGTDVVVCSGEIVNFNASKSYDAQQDLLKYYWDFGDGNSAEGLSATNRYQQGGVYEVTLTVTDNSGLDCNNSIDKKIITVVESPVAFAGEDLLACTNSEVFFDGSLSKDSDGIVNNFAWDFGDGSSGGGAKTSHVYKNPGTYKVMLTITGELVGGCDNTDMDELLVTVTDAPYAHFESQDSIGLGSSISFDASSSKGNNGNILKYLWDFGDGNKSNGASVKHTYAKSGNYPVTLTLSTDSKSECNSAVFMKSVNVNEQPVAPVLENVYAATNQTIRFNASAAKDEDGKITSYNWNFGDGASAEGVLVEHNYEKPGKYETTLTVTDNTKLENKASTSFSQIIINAAPKADIQCDGRTYVGKEFFMSGILSNDEDGQITEFNWSTGDGNFYSEKEIKHTFNSSGFYEISLTVTDNSGLQNSKSTVVKIVEVLDIPNFIINGAKVTCLNAFESYEVIIDNSKNINNLGCRWKYEDGSVASNTFKTNFSFVTTGIKTLAAEVFDTDKPGIILSSNKYLVEVNTIPVANAGEDKTIFIGGANDEVLFDANKSFDPDGDLLTYSWDFGDGKKASGVKTYHKYSQPGKYKAILTVTDNKKCNCNSSKDEVIIEVK